MLKPTRLAMLVEGPTVEESAILDRHVEYLEDLARGGRALLFGRTQTASERTVGLVILAADSSGEARRLMENDPVVAEGVMRAELFPYRIAGGSLATA